MPVAGAPSDNTTLTAILAELTEAGFDGDFSVGSDATLVCAACHTHVSAHEADLAHLRRVEGASDPADMAAVLAMRCPSCGQQGTAIVRYGPEAGPDDGDVLLALDESGTANGGAAGSSPRPG